MIATATGFERWTSPHLGAIAATALVSVGCHALARRRPADARALARGLALLLLIGEAAEALFRLSEGRLRWANALPLELCDMSALLTAAALLGRRRGPFEVAWYWGMAGAPAALLTPDVDRGFPDPEFLRFFGVHGGIVAGLALLLGEGMRPSARSWRRVYLLTLLYALLVGAIDALLGANYLYLRDKPGAGSPLDLFGPWPWYILGGAGIGLFLFYLLGFPFRRPR